MSTTTTVDPKSVINFRREFPTADLEIRTDRLRAILAAHQAEIGDEHTPAVLLLDALKTSHHLTQLLLMKAEQWGIRDQDTPGSA